MNFFRSIVRAGYVVLAVFSSVNFAGAQIVVVDAGTTNIFTAPAATNFVWNFDGVAVVGNSNSFAYKPQVQDVGTHQLTVDEIFPGGVASNKYWGVRVRLTFPATGANYYVATNGSDANPGTLGSPFKTLDKARDTVRALARPLPAGGVTVWLRGGTYYRTNTLMLTNVNDSGTLTAPIVYRSYTNEAAVISGGMAIPAASFVPLATSQTNRCAPGVNPTNIWEMDVAAAGLTHAASFPTEFGAWITYNTYSTTFDGGLCELFFNGQRLFLSRYPNNDVTGADLFTTNMLMDGVAPGRTTGTYVSPDSTNSLNYPGTYTNSAGVPVSVGGAFFCKTNDIARFTRWQSALTNGGVWLQGYWRVPWQIDGLRVLGFDVTNRVVEFNSGASPSGGIGSKYARPFGDQAEPYWALNLLEELDTPGEWCVDFNRNKIYLYPPAPITDGSVVVSDFGSPLVQITGRSNIVFQSLTFECGLGQGIYVTNGLRNLVLGCTLRNMGNVAVDFQNGGTNGVVDCDILEMAGTGILLRGGTENFNPALRVPTRHFAVNNVISNFARVTRVYSPGIDVGYGGAGGSGGGGGHSACVGTRIAHNSVSGSPHGGILHGSWDNVFEYNNVFNYCTWSDDLGGFYSYDNYGRHGNQTFRYNFIHDTPHGDAIYFDNDHPDMHIYGNIANVRVLPSESRGYGYLFKLGTMSSTTNTQVLDLHDNIAVNCRKSYDIFAPTGSIIEDNAAILSQGTPYTWTQVYTNGAGAVVQTASSAAVLASGTNMTYAADIGFVNLTNNDVRLKPDSQIYTDLPDFRQIPVEFIGLYNDEFRANVPGYSPFVLTNASASAITSTNATLTGQLYFPQFESNTTAIVYFGTTDGGTNSGAWAFSTNTGIFPAGPMGGSVGGLSGGLNYFYRCYATNAFGTAWAAASSVFRTLPPPGTPIPVVTNVTPSQSIFQNNALVLTGKVYLVAGPVYPPVGAPVYVTINGVTQTTAITNATGNFGITFDTFGIPPGTNYVITYVYAGDPNLNMATNNATTLTLAVLPQPVITVANRGVLQNSTATLVGQVSAPGPVYPSIGDDVNVTINGSTQAGAIVDAVGNFAVDFDFTGFAVSTNAYLATYVFVGGTNFSAGTNTAGVTVCPPTVTWNGVANTNFETGGGGGNWNNFPPPLNDLSSSTAIFAGAPTANQPSLTASRSVEGLQFTTTTGGWKLGTGSAANVLSIGGGGITTAGQTSGTNSISASLALGANQTWQAGTGGTLLFTGSITNNPASPGHLTINASGVVGNLILSPSAGNSINLSGTNTAELLAARTGGILFFGGDGTNAPVTTSTNIIKNFSGTDGFGLGGSGVVTVNSGTWNIGDAGRNNTGFGIGGTLNVNGGTLTFTGMRYLAGVTINLKGGSLKAVNTGYFQSNAGRFGLGNWTSGGGTTAILNVTGGFVDLAAANTGNTIGQAMNSQVNQSGGVLQNGVTAGSGTTTFTIGPGGTTANILSAVTLTGGNFLSLGAVQYGGSTGLGNVNNFNFMGGTLTLGAYTAANLGSSPTATVSANQTASSVAIGTLVNYGGTLAPGGGVDASGVFTNGAGRTVITGNYAVSNNAAVLAVDLGGTNQANAFQVAATNYDFVSISGTAALGGSLRVSLLNSFSATVKSNQTFTVLTATGGASGTFTNLVGGRVAVANVPGASFQVLTNGTSVILTNYALLAASFTASATNGATPLAVTFTDTSTGNITNRAWNFGDGGTTNTTATTVAHTFTTLGTNLVTLIVGDALATSTNTLAVVVTGAATPPVIGGIFVSGSNLIITGTNGTAGNGYRILSSTNLASWTPVATNNFAANGGYTNSLPVSNSRPAEFFRVVTP